MAKLAFLGMGVMGSPMAGHLQGAGNDVTVYNRTAPKAQAWVADLRRRDGSHTARGGAMGPNSLWPASAMTTICARSVWADGAFAGMAAARSLSITPQCRRGHRELYAAADAWQISFVDAPISGGQAGAENGALSIMCGGDEALMHGPNR